MVLNPDQISGMILSTPSGCNVIISCLSEKKLACRSLMRLIVGSKPLVEWLLWCKNEPCVPFHGHQACLPLNLEKMNMHMTEQNNQNNGISEESEDS